MRLNFVRKELRTFVDENVKPLYKTFDKAHNLSHFKFVTENCVEYAKELIKMGVLVDLEIAYLVGALHDIGISQGRENHAKTSGAMVRSCKKLKEFSALMTLKQLLKLLKIIHHILNMNQEAFMEKLLQMPTETTLFI